jgi:hypothetical protein
MVGDDCQYLADLKLFVRLGNVQETVFFVKLNDRNAGSLDNISAAILGS